MRIVFNGHDFDLEDAEARALACRQYADDLVGRILSETTMSEHEIDGAHLAESFELFIAQLADYWLQASATLTMAAATGSAGVSLAQVQEMNNFIGSLIGQGPMNVLTPEQKAEAESLLRAGPQRIVLPDA